MPAFPGNLDSLKYIRHLIENGLRKNVKLRTDGGLSTGKDIIMAAILGAEEYDFGKLLLIAEGCVMARICEKNTCPTGIATHDPKFKAKYKGDKDHVVRMMKYLAEDIRRHLSQLGFSSLKEIIRPV
jgi:glutamate synthase domain-containing protein 2